MCDVAADERLHSNRAFNISVLSQGAQRTGLRPDEEESSWTCSARALEHAPEVGHELGDVGARSLAHLRIQVHHGCRHHAAMLRLDRTPPGST